MAFLEVTNVGKSFGSREILRDIRFTVREGELVCIIGCSGSGKTTLINLIAGLTRPDCGQIRLGGRPVEGPSLDRGLIFQNYSLLPWLSALRNVELAVRQRWADASPDEIRCRAQHWLKRVHLDHALDRKPSELSGGMRQRVALARGLATEPSILLLDEPLGALDALTRAELQDELLRLQAEERRTILMITNDVDEGILLADRILPLSSGPGATLGEAVEVTVRRPRDRRRINSDPAYPHNRKAILSHLLSRRPSNRKFPKTVDVPEAEILTPEPTLEAALP